MATARSTQHSLGLTYRLDPKTYELLKRRAAKSGLSVATYVRTLIWRDVRPDAQKEN